MATMSNDLIDLPAYGDDGELRVVVEAPRGCGLKLKYEPKLRAFSYGKALPVGLSYPYDWGFVPGTKAADGDPLDALVLGDVPTYPGIVIPCRLLGAILVTQSESGKRERNDRLLAVPLGADRFAHLEDFQSMDDRLKAELEQFFLSTTFFSQKKARIEGWKGAGYAHKLVRKALEK